MAFLQKILKHTDLLLGAALLIVVGMLILPMPTWALDLCIAIALTSAVVILLTAVNCDEPLQFSVFPSLLLLTTLFRLAIAIAATKLILGSGYAGAIIHTFGDFVMGGDMVVGFVVFLILMIVQFIVITNGAGRVSEVVARFTLDAMPGKQMAIDADLAAGLIDENDAKRRRKGIKLEADFFGAMDGASKFVKGDAIAALLIIAINIIGGFAVGFLRGQGDAMMILQKYALLSVGAGLVSQIPALLISTASGLLVTRSGQERGMSGTVIGQLIGQPRVLLATGVSMIVAGILPGFPLVIFGMLGAVLVIASQFVSKNPEIHKQLTETEDEKALARAEAEAREAAAHPTGPEGVLALVRVDALEVEIGYGLSRLADRNSGGDLPDRVTAARKQIAMELGFVMPSVRIRDDARLSPNEYVIKVRGEEVAKAEAFPDQLLAIGSGAITGTATKEPVFGLDALWIDEGQREAAERSGYTVIEPSAMMATHLSEVVKAHAPELLTRQDVNQLLESAKETNKAAVEELVPNVLSIGGIQKVLQHLLRERVPVRDLVTILETMADYGEKVSEPEQLGELVRSAIARTITRQHIDPANKLHCLTLDPVLERKLQDSIGATAGGSMIAMDPNEQRQLIEDLQTAVKAAGAGGAQPVLLCNATLRLPLRKTIERYIAHLDVLAYNEVAATADVEFVGQVGAQAAAPAA